MGNAGLPCGITTRVSLVPDCSTAFAVWQSMFTRAAAAAAGFISLELIPNAAGSRDWHIIQRFRSTDLLEHWRKSPSRQRLMADLAPLRTCGPGEADDEIVPDFHSLSAVTEVITTQVKRGRQDAYQDWAERVQARQAAFPGYMGTLVQAPLSADMPYWTTLVRFETPRQLDAWLGSPERAALLKETDPETATWQSRRMSGPFAGWFPAAADRPAPPAWKQTCLVLLVLFPVVMLEMRFLSPLLAAQPAAVATFIGNAISVSLVSWPLIKIAAFCLGWWLQPPPDQRWLIEALGAVTLAGLYSIELLAFTLFA